MLAAPGQHNCLPHHHHHHDRGEEEPLPGQQQSHTGQEDTDTRPGSTMESGGKTRRQVGGWTGSDQRSISAGNCFLNTSTAVTLARRTAEEKRGPGGRTRPEFPLAMEPRPSTVGSAHMSGQGA
ncbi:unnamed protein product [Arctogadus glacialis]